MGLLLEEMRNSIHITVKHEVQISNQFARKLLRYRSPDYILHHFLKSLQNVINTVDLKISLAESSNSFVSRNATGLAVTRIYE